MLFMFPDCITHDPSYAQVVQDSWNYNIQGTAMYRLWSNLKLMQIALKPLIRKITDIQQQIQQARLDLKQAQEQLNQNLYDDNLREQAKSQEKTKQKGILTLMALDGRVFNTPEQIEDEILQFYTNLIGTSAGSLRGIDITAIRRGKILPREFAQSLIQPIEDKEIWEALMSIGNHKAPGTDGFNAYFFKVSWNVVGHSVKEAIREFFNGNKLYKAASCSLVTMIPKSSEAKTVKDMRPITCCSTVYKIISKILIKRLGKVISAVIDDSQLAFVPGKVIHDNIMLAQGLIRGYDRKNISPKCMIQMDIQKAYDTVEWIALNQILIELGFPHKFVTWIMVCVTTVSYRYSINGTPTRILKAKRGLRQGDPVSPLLFVLIMEYLHRGDLMSVQMMMAKFRDFSATTGLEASPSKCKVINHWSTRLLSYAGRLQLIRSVIFAITNYWMQIFLLPKKVLNHIDSLCRRFLWTGKDMPSRKSPISWDHICDPRAASGMNLISLAEWNIATIGKLLWNLCAKKDKLWIRWIHFYYIKRNDVNTYQPKANSSWILKAMFKHRDVFCQSALWHEFQATGKYDTSKMYRMMRGDKPRVAWRSLMFNNHARPRAIFTLWMACQNRLPTKDRLSKIGILTDGLCVYCEQMETNQHLFFDCAETKKTWIQLLTWMKIRHTPGDWTEEAEWICSQTKGKSGRAKLLKLAATEMVYATWNQRNKMIF
ncbi:uncharacterized protein LOC131626004 [Vicia villosa]|uniref:uncharacterized protein LOC131626004 n=1 Tax=Vicia villosa TaxID=3911 RepID=UPI00273AA6E4|nr:uncharacterized protein LOC131626004 [Vicia villosa]